VEGGKESGVYSEKGGGNSRSACVWICKKKIKEAVGREELGNVRSEKDEKKEDRCVSGPAYKAGESCSREKKKRVKRGTSTEVGWTRFVGGSGGEERKANRKKHEQTAAGCTFATKWQGRGQWS